MFFRSTMMIYRSETYSWRFFHFSAKSQFAIISWKFHELTFFYHVTQNICCIEKWLLSSFRSIQTLTLSYTSHHRTTRRLEIGSREKRIENFHLWVKSLLYPLRACFDVILKYRFCVQKCSVSNIWFYFR